MNPQLITPVLIAVLVIWGIYRRARRFIGRQRLEPGRLRARVGVFALLGGFMLLVSARDTRMLFATLAGASCGAALGWLGLKYTRFETTPEGRFYTPHAYIGLVVLALFVGRVLYRMMILYYGAHGFAPGAPGAAGPDAFASVPYAPQNPYANLRTPLTLGIFGTLVGYYISYYLGVLSKSRQPAIPGQAGGAR